MNLIKITDDELKKTAIIVQNDPRYGEEGKIIKAVFNKFPKNDDREIIAMKISLIDMTNSTNLNKHLRTVSLVKLIDKIMNSNFDERVSKGDITLVEELSKWTKGEGINLFSFISKYCLYHNFYCYNRDDYAIYDKILNDNIPYYISTEDYYKLTNKVWIKSMCEKLRESCNYQEYMKIIDFIIKNNNITVEKPHRMLDWFIWYNNRGNDEEKEKIKLR